jgi:hypothetical protein
MTVTTKELWKATERPPAPDQHPADDDYSPPVSTVKLPSRGLVYPPESPLYRCESLDIKAVTAKEENILASPALIKKGIVLTELMRACITNRSVDPDSMLVGDRNAVLVSIRASAYGPRYGATVTCPDCGESEDYDFDISKITLKTLDVDPVGGPGTNEFSFTLPVSGKEVQFRLLDAGGVAKLDRDTDAVKKKTGREQNVTMRLIAQVTKIQGVETKNLPRAIENLAARDAKALRSYMDKIAPGVDMEQEFVCSSCGKANEVEIPVGTDFFWPPSDG